jgi:hypothetical protein
MKRIFHFLLILLLAGVVSAALWRGFTHSHESEHEAEHETAGGEKGEEKKDEGEELVVKLTPEKLAALHVETATAKAHEMKPRTRAFGRVVDPGPLLTLLQELSAAEMAGRLSRMEFERTQNLQAAGEAASRKTAEAAEAQFRADELKMTGVRQQIRLEWGGELAELPAAARPSLGEALASFATVLVRVEVLAGDLLTTAPSGAEVMLPGHEEQPLPAAAVTPASGTDGKSQGQAFLLRMEKAPAWLRPGQGVTAWLEAGGEPRAGLVVPREAILRHDGRTWVYVAEEEAGEFARKPITLETPVAEGWWVASEGGIEADEKIVTTGAATLLSEELKAQGGAEPD